MHCLLLVCGSCYCLVVVGTLSLYFAVFYGVVVITVVFVSEPFRCLFFCELLAS